MKINKKLSLLLIFTLLSSVLLAQKKTIDASTHKDWRRVDSKEMSTDGRFISYKYVYMYDNELSKEAKNTVYLYDVNKKKTKTLSNVSDFKYWAGGKWASFNKLGAKDSEERVMTLMRLSDGKEIEWHRKETLILSDISSTASYTKREGDYNNLVVFNVLGADSIKLNGLVKYDLYDNEKSVIYMVHEGEEAVIRYGELSDNMNSHKEIYRNDKAKLKYFWFSYLGMTVEFGVPLDAKDKYGKSDKYSYNIKTGKLSKLIQAREISIDDNSKTVDYGSLDLLENNKFTVFNVGDKNVTKREKRDTSKRDKSFELELWSWDDDTVPSMQSDYYREPRQEPIKYVLNNTTGKTYPITSHDYTSVRFSRNKTMEHAILINEIPYSANSDWRNEARADFYVLNLNDGERYLLAKNLTSRPEWSPNGDYIIYWDSHIKAWISVEPETMSKVNLSENIPYAVHNEYHDKPNPVSPYGIAAWSKDGSKLFIEDAYDIWLVDVSGKTEPSCFTHNFGRETGRTLRFLNHNYSDIVVDVTEPQMLQSLSDDMGSGIFTLSPKGKFTKNIEGAYSIRLDALAKDGSRYLFTRQTYREDRDIWVADRGFKNPRKVSDVSPQLEDYNIGNVEIVEWENYKGTISRGLLYTPEDYVKGKSYPTIVNFYETHTGGLHGFHLPGPSSAMINVIDYVSNGYIVFMPDVYFEIGEPAQSSYDIVVSGTKELIGRGIIDKKRVGLQGHSWSGYQTACLITMTDIFTCVNTGAPITNMTSGYVGLREESGSPRMFMYEDWQCRMGMTMWDDLDAFVRNSPIMHADKITTPTLIFHCDKDGAVSYTEGRSLFLAMRRLQKPCWLINYKGEGHFVSSDAASADWTLRMKQFFDYYLNYTAMPRWMSEGINIEERGYDQKLDFVK